jgi:hypothetical protein
VSNAADLEQVHIAAWPLYPGKETLKYPDPYTNVAEANADVSNCLPRRKSERTGLDRVRRGNKLSGLVSNQTYSTPPGKELEDPNIYNGNGRIFGPDGQNLVPHPDKDKSERTGLDRVRRGNKLSGLVSNQTYSSQNGKGGNIHLTPAYAIETGSFTLAPWQTITAEGIKLNTPPGKASAFASATLVYGSGYLRVSFPGYRGQAAMCTCSHRFVHSCAVADNYCGGNQAQHTSWKRA